MKSNVSSFDYEHRIILIDDDIENHEIFNTSLHELHHQIRNFTSAKKALYYLSTLQRKDRPSIIVTNFEMQEMDGMAVLQVVKESPSLYHIPVIVYSSAMNNSLQQRLKANGAAGCFIKSDGLEDVKEFLLILGIIFENSIFD